MNRTTPEYFGVPEDMSHLSQIELKPNTEAVLYGWKFKPNNESKLGMQI